MFTGMVEELGIVRAVRRGRASSVLSIGARRILSDLRIGDSVAVNGVCLTAAAKDDGGFIADVMHETLKRSSLGALSVGSHVNLERAMAVGGRFGGHIVSGHIDGTGIITAIHTDENAIWYTVSAGRDLLRHIVEKGSITIDGISLTVAAVGESWFAISAIPHTVAVTILGEKRMGDTVNLETDMIGKYVEKLVCPKAEQQPKNTITMDFLSKYGF